MSASLPRTLSVLLVEDSQADGRLLMETFKPAIAAGELVLQTVKSLALAVDALKRFDFSCVLLDLGLPDGRGIENVRALREVDRKTAILVLTGLVDEKLAAEALALGAQDYLVKGENDGEQLLKQLRRAVQRNRQTYALETQRDKAFFEASHDALTLLPNAALFADRARQQMAAATAQPSSAPAFAIAYLEVQGLSALRDRHGGAQADELLKTLSERWSEPLRPSDTLAHLGAGVFALLKYPASTSQEWATVVDDCRRQLASLQALIPGDVQITLSVGVMPADPAVQGVDAMLAAARKQATQSKPTAKNESSTGATLGNAPLAAVRWQPWVDVSTLRCVGLELQQTVEASHPDSAAQVLVAADALIHQAKLWIATRFDLPLLALDVPVSALESDGFVEQLIARFVRAGLPSGSVQLEISEAAFRKPAQHSAALASLRSHGFRVVLEGDGSQDISLHDFAACALDGYKLSPALVRALMDENLYGTARRVVTAILGAAQQLGSTVTATGVDSEAAATALRLIGVRYLQGRALLPPLEPESVPMAWERAVSLRG